MTAPRPIFAYVHIQKTGGTSMRASLADLFGAERILWHGMHGVDLGKMIGAGTPLPDCDVVGGHVPGRGLLRLATQRPRILVALLRNPVQQIVSYYHHVRCEPGNQFHVEGPLFDALHPDAPFARHVRGLQSQMLCGRPGGHAACAFLAATPHLVARLDRAQHLLDRIGALAGLGRSAPLRSENRRAGEPEPLSAEVLARLRPLAAPDRVLWHHFQANGGFSERLPGTGAGNEAPAA